MKILKPEPIEVIRLAIKKNGYDTEYLNLIETSHDEVIRFMENLFQKFTSPLLKGYKTSVETRKSVCNRNGKSISLSFRGPNPAETKNMIIDAVVRKFNVYYDEQTLISKIKAIQFATIKKKDNRKRNKVLA